MAGDDPVEPRTLRTRLVDRGRDLIRRGGRFLGVVLLLLLGLLLLRGLTSPYGYVSIEPGVLFAIGLVGAGLLLLRGQEPVDDEVGTARPRRPRSPLGILTLSAVFLVDGLLLLLGNLGVAQISVGQMAAVGLLLVGTGLLVGVWWGRSRFLILVGMLMVPVVVVGGFIHFPLSGSIGGYYLEAHSVDDIDDTYELLVGTMTLDLLRVKKFPAERTIDFEVASGNVTVYVPERVGLSVTGHIEWGNASVGRGRQDGEDLELASAFEGKPGAGHVTIDFNGGIASLYIERISRRERFGPPQQRKYERRPRRDRDGARDGRRDERRDGREGRKRDKA